MNFIFYIIIINIINTQYKYKINDINKVENIVISENRILNEIKNKDENYIVNYIDDIIDSNTPLVSGLLYTRYYENFDNDISSAFVRILNIHNKLLSPYFLYLFLKEYDDFIFKNKEKYNYMRLRCLYLNKTYNMKRILFRNKQKLFERIFIRDSNNWKL